MAKNLFNDYLKKRSTSTTGSASSTSSTSNTGSNPGSRAKVDYKNSVNYKMREEQAAAYKAGARKRAYAKKKAEKEGRTWYPVYQKAGEGSQSLNKEVSYRDMMSDYLNARKNSTAPQPVVTGSKRYPGAGNVRTGNIEVNKASGTVPASLVRSVAATGDNNVARITRQYALAGSKAANPEITNLGDLRKDDYSFKTDNYAANRIAEERRKAAARTSAAAAGELAAKHYVNQLNADKDAAEKRAAAGVTQTALSDEAKKNLAEYVASGKKDATSFVRPEKTLGVQDLTSDSYENTREYQAMQKLINPRKNNPNMSAMENAAYNTVHNMLGLPAAVGVEIGTSMASGMEGLANTAKGIVTGEKPSDNDLYGASQAAGFREGILRGVRDITGNEYDGVRTKREDITDFLTGVGLDMANSVARAHLLGAAGGSIQASGSAANDSYLDTAHDDSVSVGQANALAVVNAFNEGFFEHFSIENYLKMSPANSLKAFEQNLLKTMAVEGEEEGATEIGNIIGEMLILRDNSQYMQEYKNRIASGEDSRDALVNTVASAAGRIGQATVGGALSGVGSTGTRQLTGTFSNSMDFDDTWRNGQNPYAEIADSIDASTASGVDAKRAAEEYAARVENGGSVSMLERGTLQNAIDNAASEQQRVEKHEEIAANESLDEETRTTAAEFAEAARNGEEYTEEEDTFLRKANEEALEAAAAEPVEEETVPEPAATGYGEKPEGISDALWREITAEPYNMLSNAERSKKLEHRAAEVGLASQIRDMETKALDSWSKEYGTSGQQAFKDNFQAGMRTSDYVRAFNKIYDAGRYNVPIGNIDESYAALISNKDTFENIYKAGANDARALYDEATKLSYHDRQEERIGGVLDAYRTVPEDVKSVFESLGKKTGIQFVLVDSRYDKGAGENALGSYRGDGIITVDVNPNQDGFNIMQTTSHEMTHWLQEYAPMEYEMFKEEAIRAIMKSSGTTLDEEIQKRRAAGYTGTREEITDEIVADATGTFLNDADFAKNIAENQPKMATRIVEWLKSMVDALKTLVSTKNIRKAAAALKEDLNAYESARDMWMIAVDEASEKMKTSRYSDEGISQNQLKMDENGQNIVLDNGRTIPLISNELFTEEDIDNNKPEVLRTVRDILDSLSGEQITIKSDNRTVEISKRFSKEYAYANSARRANREIKLAKFNAAAKMKEIIENAADPKWEENREEKHEYDSGRGVTRYTVDFALGKENSYKLYSGEMVVRMNMDGKDYVHDIVRIKKSPTAQQVVGKSLSPDVAPAAPNNVITSSEKSVNEKLGKYDIAGQISMFSDDESQNKETAAAIKEIRDSSVRSFRVKTIGRDHTILKEMLKDGSVSLVGRTISSVDEMAQAMQIYRDPRFETFHAVFLNDKNEVVKETGITSTMPGRSGTVPEGQEFDEYYEGLADSAKMLGATSYYIEHNHPSGNVEPSDEDIHATENIRSVLESRNIMQKGHIIIDHTKYTVLKTSQVNDHQFTLDRRDRRIIAFEPREVIGEGKKDKYGLVGQLITGPDDVARYEIYAKNHKNVILFQNSRGRVILIQTVSDDFASDKEKFAKYIHDTAVKEGSVSAFLLTGEGSSAMPAASELYDRGVFRDVLNIRSGGRISLLEERGKTAEDKSGYFMGVRHQTKELRYQKILKEDSEGNSLTTDQQDFFEKSKVKDDSGRLKVMYHGTPTGGFTVFRNGLEFFTDNKNYADNYQNESASSRGSGKGESSPETYKVYLNITSPFDTRDPKIRKEFMDDYVRGGWALGIDPSDPSNAFMTSGLPSWEEADNIYEWMEENDLLDKYDGLILDEGAYQDEHGNPVPRGLSYVTFHPEQVKNVTNEHPTSDKDIRYQKALKDNGVDTEETGSLVAVHNVNLDKIGKMLDMSSLPMPSIAITKADMGWNDFGSVSFVFRKSTIDPKTDRRNRVYGADAWTPTFANLPIENEVDEDVRVNARAIIKKETEGKIPPYLASEATHFIDARVNDIAENQTFDDLIDQAMSDRGMQAAYIASKGETLSDNEKTVTEPTMSKGKISLYEAMVREFGSELDGASEMPTKTILQEYGPRIQKVYRQSLLKEGTGEAMVEKQTNALLNSKFGGAYTGWRAVSVFTGAEKFKETGVRYETRTVRDDDALASEISKKLDKDGFKSWLEDLFSGIITGSGIRNNVDPYTPSGNRRSFAATHYSVTPENIVRAMVESRDGKSKAVTTPPGIRGIIAAGSSEFSSIDEIHKDEGRLQPKDTASNIDELENRLQEVERKISDQGSYKSIDTIEDAIIEAAGKKRVTAAAIRKAFDWYGWIKYTENDVNEILDIIKEARQVPTDMFEAKPERTVDFSEVAHVLVPDGISEDILTKLADKGFDVVTYDSEVAGDRTEKLKSLDGVRFQLGIDETATPAPVYAESEKLDQATEDLSKLIINARNVMPSSQKITRLTSDLAKEWNSTVDRAMVRQQIEKLYASMAVSENANGREFADTAAAIGGEILDHAVIKDAEQEERWSSFKKTLRNTIIYIPASNIHDIEPEGFNALRKRYFQKIQFTTDQKYMEHTGADVYRELKQQFPDYFTLNPDQMYDVDAVQEIMNVRDNGGPVLESGTPNNAQDYNETAYALGERILKAFFDEADEGTRKQYMDTYHSAVLDLRVASSRELKKTRAALETKYNRDLALLKKKYAANNLAVEDYIAKKAELDEKLKSANLDREAMADRLRKHKEDYVKRQRKASDIRRMESSMRKIQRMIEQPTSKNHVPAPLAKGIQQLFSVIDLTTDFKGKANDERRRDYARLQSTDFTNALGDFKNVVNAVMKNDGIITDPETGIDTRITLDPDFLTRLETQEAYIEEMAKAHEGIPKVRKMPYERVHELYQLIQSINHMLEYANKFTTLDRNMTVSSFASRTMNELRGRKAQTSYTEEAPARKYVQSMLRSGMLDSPTFFNLIGGDGGTGDEMYAALRNGLDKKTVAVNESMKYVERTMNELGISGKDVQQWSQKTRTVKLGNKTLTVTDAQLMELYVLNKREQARKHMYGNSENLETTRVNGGIQFDSVSGKNKKELNRSEAARYISEADVAAVVDLLSPKQKQLAERMQHFLATSVSNWGNETSMNLYGYEKFLEPSYWPIRTASDYRTTKTSDIERGMTTLANMGFTKATVNSAQNPLVIGNIFDTFTNHIDKMSSYNAFLPALEDMQKWLNYQDGYESMKVVMKDAMSGDALEYLNNLILDLNGSRGRADKWGSFTNIFLGKAKAVAVAWSPSVAIQQPFSIVRAAAEMNPKYIAAAMSPANLTKRKEAWETAKKYAPIVIWKEIGGPDISTGRTLKSAIFGSDGFVDTVAEWGTKGAEMGDRITWTTLWQAAEEEVKDTRKDLEVGSPDYYAAAKKIFDHVIDFTQVVDSPLHRTEMMKSKSDFAKIATSFQSEPMKTYDMLYREIYKATHGSEKAKKKARAKIGKAAAVLVMNILVTNAAKSVMGALKDPDKDKTYGERWKDAFLDNIGVGGFAEALDPENENPKKWSKAVLDFASSDFAPTAYVPYISTLLDQMNGLDSNIGTQSFSDLASAKDELEKVLSGEPKEGALGAIYKMSPALHPLGISSKNIMKWTGAVIDEVIADAGLSDAQYARNRMMLNMENDANAKTFVAEAMKEYARGNKELGDKIIQDLMKAGIDEAKIQEKIGDMLKAEPELELAARSYVNGAKGDYESLRQQLIQKGYSEELVDKKLDTAIDKLAPASRADIATAIYEGNDKETVDAYIKYMRSLGKEDKDIRSDIKSGMTSKYKEIYKSSDRATQRKIEQRLETLQVLKENIYTTKDFYYTSKDGSVDRSKGLKWEK